MLEHVLGELRREELKLEVDHVAPLTGMLELFAFIHAHFGAPSELIPRLSGANLLRARFLRRSSKAPIVASPLIALISDCCATTSPAYCTEATIFNVKKCFGFVTDSARLLSALEASR